MLFGEDGTCTLTGGINNVTRVKSTETTHFKKRQSSSTNPTSLLFKESLRKGLVVESPADPVIEAWKH